MASNPRDVRRIGRIYLGVNTGIVGNVPVAQEYHTGIKFLCLADQLAFPLVAHSAGFLADFLGNRFISMDLRSSR